MTSDIYVMQKEGMKTGEMYIPGHFPQELEALMKQNKTERGE